MDDDDKSLVVVTPTPRFARKRRREIETTGATPSTVPPPQPQPAGVVDEDDNAPPPPPPREVEEEVEEEEEEEEEEVEEEEEEELDEQIRPEQPVVVVAAPTPPTPVPVLPISPRQWPIDSESIIDSLRQSLHPAVVMRYDAASEPRIGAPHFVRQATRDHLPRFVAFASENDDSTPPLRVLDQSSTLLLWQPWSTSAQRDAVRATHDYVRWLAQPEGDENRRDRYEFALLPTRGADTTVRGEPTLELTFRRELRAVRANELMRTHRLPWQVGDTLLLYARESYEPALRVQIERINGEERSSRRTFSASGRINVTVLERFGPLK